MEATSKACLVQEDKLPASFESLMDIAPEHQFILREGSARIEVKLLQWTLNQYGLKTAIDGIFGPETKKCPAIPSGQRLESQWHSRHEYVGGNIQRILEDVISIG